MKLYSFYWDCGRNGRVEGLFIASPDELEDAYGKMVYFGEILGKHSEVCAPLGRDDVTELDVSGTTVTDLLRALGVSTVSGYNPLEYI